MDSIQSGECQICRDFGRPYSVGYIEASSLVCSCGNIIKMKNHPAIYLGSVQHIHLLIIPFPGCTICGKASNLATNMSIPCMDTDTRDRQMREIYHNYGGRN